MREAALTALLLGPTMGVVLTYAILSVPLHRLALVTPGMALVPLFARAAGSRYDAAAVATAFVAVTTAWGPVAMAFLRRSADERGEVEPMPAILPLNAVFLFPWLVILGTRLLLGR